MELDKLFGLPAHPLLVHLPVVLIPLASIGLVAIAVSASLRQRLGWYVFGLTVLATLGTFLAAGSGESLEHDVTRSATLEHHTQLGDQMRPIAVLLLAAVLGVMLLGVFTARRPLRPSVGAAVASRPSIHPALRAAVVVAAMAVAALSTVWIIRTGHEGAKATWEADAGGG